MASSSREVRLHLERGAEALRAARDLAADGFWRDAASRAYYAVFHAATAMLLARGRTVKTHRGLVALVQEQFVATGILEERHYNTLRHARDLREESDYDVSVVVGEDEVEDVLVEAEAFLRRVDELLA